MPHDVKPTPWAMPDSTGIGPWALEHLWVAPSGKTKEIPIWRKISHIVAVSVAFSLSCRCSFLSGFFAVDFAVLLVMKSSGWPDSSSLLPLRVVFTGARCCLICALDQLFSSSCPLLVRETATIVMLGCLLASGLVWLLLLVLSNLQCVLEPSLRGAAGISGFPSYVRFFHHYFLKYFSFLSIAVRMLPCAMLFSLHNYWAH